MQNNLVPTNYTNVGIILATAINSAQEGIVNDTSVNRQITHPELGLQVTGTLGQSTLDANYAKFEQNGILFDAVSIYDVRNNQRYAQKITSSNDLGTQATAGEMKSKSFYAERYGSYLDLNEYELKILQTFTARVTQGLGQDGLKYLLKQVSQNHLVAIAQATILQTLDIVPSAGGYIAGQLGGGIAPDYSAIANNTAKVPGLFYFDSYTGENPTRYTDAVGTIQFAVNGTPSTMFDAGGNFVPANAGLVTTFFHRLYDAYYNNVGNSLRKKLMLKIPSRTYRQMYSHPLISQAGQTNSADNLLDFVKRGLDTMYDISAYKEIDTYMSNVGSNNAFGYAYDPSPDNLQIVMSPTLVHVYPEFRNAFKASYTAATAGIIPQKIYGNGGGIMKITNLSQTPA